MDIFFQLLAAYGLCFGFQQKATFLHRGPFLTALFECTFCTGFHCGWMIWGAPHLISWTAPNWQTLPVWCFGSAAFCYVADTAVRWLEAQIPGD